MLRENNTKLTADDENANLDVHERIVFCHIRQMRKVAEGEEPPASDEEKEKPIPKFSVHKVEKLAHEKKSSSLTSKKRRGRPPNPVPEPAKITK